MSFLKKIKTLADDDEYQMTYSAHKRYLDKLNKVWDHLGIQAKKDESISDDEHYYILEGTQAALTEFYESAFNEKPSPGEITKS